MKPGVPLFFKSLFAGFIFLSIAAHATHIRGGQIRVVSSNGLTCTIELTVITNTASEIRFGSGTIDFGDGTTFITPERENTTIGNLHNVGIVKFTVIHSYSSPGIYTLSYNEKNLTAGILNVYNSVQTPFIIETAIHLTGTGSYSSPDFASLPILLAPSGNTYSFSTAVIDSSPGQFYYKYSILTTPIGITDYKIPGDLKVNPDNGTVSWNTMFYEPFPIIGDYWLELKVEKFTISGENLGYVVRAFQIMLEDAETFIDITSSVDDPNNRITVLDGKDATVKVFFQKTVDENEKLSFELNYSEALNNNVTFEEFDSLMLVSQHGYVNTRVGKLSIKTTPDIVSDLPYPVTLRGLSRQYQADITLLYMTKDIPLPDPTWQAVVTGLEEDQHLKIYPIPFQSELYVDGTSFTEATFMDELGRDVMRSPLQQNQPVNTSSLSAGFYLLKVGGRVYKVIRN